MRLRTRFALAFFLAGATALGLALHAQEEAGRSLLVQRAAGRAEALAEWLARAAAPGLLEDGLPLDSTLVPVAGLPGVLWARVENAKGRTAYYWSAPDAAGPAIQASAFVPSEAGGRVEVSISTRGIEPEVAGLRRRWLGPALAGLAGLAALSWLLGMALGRRLEAAVGELETLAGRPGEREARPASEVGRLLRAVSTLQESLRDKDSRGRELERLRDELAHMLVHDLRHPLSVLRMSVAVLREHSGLAEDSPRRGAAFARADSAMDRLDTMITTLLQIARLRSAEATITRERLLVGPFLRACAPENELLVEQAGRRWSLDIAPEAEHRLIHGDAALLCRLLGNLVLNAVDHGGAASRVAMGARVCRRDRSKVELFVHDDGPGLNGTAVEAVAGRFPTFVESARHAGLGLAFCRMAAERHGSRLAIDSAPDRGTTFSISLPAAAQKAKASEDAPKEGEVPA